MDNDSIHASPDKSELIGAKAKSKDKNAAQIMDEKQNNNNSSSSPTATAHRSCPNLSLSMSIESLIRNFERERTSSAAIHNKSGRNNVNDILQHHQAGAGVPLCSANLLLPTPKTKTLLDGTLMSRICKSMNNIDALSHTKKPFHFLLNKQPGGEITEDEFFELIERLNANRLQDQRAEFPSTTSADDIQNGGEDEQNDGQDRTLNANADQLLTMIMMHQNRRYNDQRASPVLSDYETQEILRRLSLRAPNERIDKKAMDDQLYELIMSYQGERLEDQRSELGGRKTENSNIQSSKILEKKESKKKAKKTNSTSTK